MLRKQGTASHDSLQLTGAAPPPGATCSRGTEHGRAGGVGAEPLAEPPLLDDPAPPVVQQQCFVAGRRPALLRARSGRLCLPLDYLIRRMCTLWTRPNIAAHTSKPEPP